MRKLTLAAVAAIALPIALPAMAQQNGAKQNAPAQGQQQIHQQQMQSSNQGSGQQMSPGQIRQVQQALDQKGFKAGRADGKLGPKTKNALNSFQKSQGLQSTGQPDQQTLAALGINQSSTTGQGPANQQQQPMQSGQSKQPAGQPGGSSNK